MVRWLASWRLAVQQLQQKRTGVDSEPTIENRIATCRRDCAHHQLNLERPAGPITSARASEQQEILVKRAMGDFMTGRGHRRAMATVMQSQ